MEESGADPASTFRGVDFSNTVFGSQVSFAGSLL